MAPRNERDELADAWRALGGVPAGPGWRTISVRAGGPCRVLAGRQTPGDEEALLIDIGAARLPPIAQLPQGRGFAVTQVTIDPAATSVWIAVTRRLGGSLELFAAMAEDIVRTLHRIAAPRPERTLRVLLDRVRSWQIFMDRGDDGVLSAERELGLVGEVVMLGRIMDAGVSPLSVCEGWEGPRDGVHDFRWRSGAIEVKTSSAQPGSFPVSIGSIHQLDDTEVQSLFLAAVRVTQVQAGFTLPELVQHIRDRLADEEAALAEFNNRLLQGGFSDAQAERYSRRFELHDIRLFPVSTGFPRLTRSTVSAGITEVRYKMDLDMLSTAPLALDAALIRIGAV